MKTFKELIIEAEGNLYYEVSINDDLRQLLSDVLKDEGYTVKIDDSVIVVTPKQSERLVAFQNRIYAIINKEFADGNETIIKFVGSSKIDDLIDSDLTIEVDAVYK